MNIDIQGQVSHTFEGIMVQSNLCYVTFQGNSEIWSPKTGGRLIQV
jgi:hypothetical protein